MRNKDIDESVVGAAPGESAPLRARHRSQLALSAELGALRDALQTAGTEDCAAREEALRAAFRARLQRRSERRQRRRVPVLAAAAVTAVAVVAAAWVALGRPGAGPQTGDARVAAGSSAAVFQPLMYAPRPSPWESYSVVRVRIPLSALAPSAATEPRGTVDADVLVGEDGLARAIRFDAPQGFTADGTAQTGGTR